jgi:Esterase PHB depolymerase
VFSMKRIITIASLVLLLACGCRKSEPARPEPATSALRETISTKPEPAQPQQHEPERKGEFVTAFAGPPLFPQQRNPNISYGLNPALERYFVHVSQEYSDATAYGLIVFTDASETFNQLPDGWREVLDSRRYLFIAAQSAGNNQYVNRRLGLAVMGALEMMKHYRIDPNRVYAAGFSGGARMSGLLGFYQSDIFRGTIQNCGVDFYKPVPMVAATSPLDTAGQPYGVLAATPGEIAAARRVRFALITGTNDFRRGNILDIFNGGFAREGFQARLFDVPGMAHDIAGAETLSAVLDFLETSP